MLAGELRLRGVDVIETRQPGGTPLGRRLREAFLETEEAVAPMAEMLLFAADRAQHVELLIKPALAAGRVVISDRYADATFAYQGAGRGFDEKTVNQVIKLATGGLKPDLTLFFDISIENALKRMSGSASISPAFCPAKTVSLRGVICKGIRWPFRSTVKGTERSGLIPA